MNLTAVGAIDNRGGTLASDGSMNIAAGSLDNTGGQLKSLGAMRMETGVVDNTAGFIGAKDTLEANTQAFTNAAGGVVFGQGKVSVKTNGAAYDNRGGQTLAGGDLSIHAGAIDNTASLIRSQGTTKLSADTVNNAHTNNNTSSGAEQGIEGRDVDITTGHLNNASGAIRANANASITSSGMLDNTLGLVSAVDTLSIADANATATKTLAVRNTDGTLTANKALNLDAARFSGDGRTTSGGDLRIALTQDVVNNAEVRAHGHLNYETTGHLTNNGKLLAGGALTAGGREVENTASAEMSGASTRVQATGTLTNQGLIDSQGHTVIEAATFLNTGPGRTYGDQVSVQAGSVLNEAATIASRGRLELGAGSVENRQGALLFSGADMSIDATSRVVNEASTIESLARLSISTPRLENLNTGFATTETTTTRAVAERYIVLDGQRYRESELGRCHKCASDRSDSGQASLARLEYVIPSARYPFEEGYARQPYAINPALYPAGDPAWKLFKVAEGDTASLMASLRAYNADFMARARRDFRELNVTSTRTTQTEVTNAGVAGRIASAGDMTLGGAQVLNDNSRITAGGTLLVPGGSVTNTETRGRRLAVDGGTLRGDSVEYKPYRVRPGYFGTAAHTEIAQNVSTRLGSSAVLENTRSAMNTAPGSAQGVAVGAQAGRTGAVDGQVFEVRAAGPAPGVVRTSAPNTALPDASLFGVRPGGLYVVETDPRFTDHRNWLASDYLLGQLGLDPARVQKRLGDGFYEQRLVREQVAQLTGHRFLEGHASDDEQYLALMNAGVTFARAFQLRPGIALTAEQMARLTSDIVWLVEQSVTLPDGTTTQALVPQVYARLRPGDIDGQGSVLSGEDVGLRLAGELRNSGTVAGRRVVEINAANIRNLEGRLSGDAVGLGAREDLDIIGGTVDAESSLVAQAGHDLNVESTTRGATSTSGASDTSRTNLDRIAGLYVSNPNGVLLAGAGNDVNLVAAVLSNTGQGGHTAIHAARDLHLATVSTSVKQNAIANAGNHLRTRESEEVGSTVSAEGSISM
ncbi:MAG TPA: filamentous hemagglutinin, partial [Polyangia bacterium]|nr:filamentous hemagglutinin [Polyangia bacterium]